MVYFKSAKYLCNCEFFCQIQGSSQMKNDWGIFSLALIAYSLSTGD